MGAAGRLAELRGLGHDALAPLWIETLPPEEALGELRGREGPLLRLQEARFLKLLGREDEARAVLEGLGSLPPGLEEIRRELLAAPVEEPPRPAGGEPRPIATKTLAELYASQGDVDAAVATYREVLARDPDDGEARERLRQLLGRERAGGDPVAALTRWLERVRAWRRVRGV